jgi:1-acyl-sn-glycerol-3-phosphate acyltransferase
MSDALYRTVVGAARVVFAAQGLRFTITGSEHVPRTGGAVMAINHVGYLDFTYAGLAARPAGRLVRFMAKKEVFDHRVSGPLMRGMRHIPVDRSAGSGSFREAVERLRAGEVVGVFPEATISRSFEIKELKAGAVRLASAARVPLLPVAVWGSQRVWTKGRPKRLGRTRTPIVVTIGPPMEVARGTKPDDALAELRDRMAALLHAAQTSYPDRPSGPEDDWWLPARQGGSAPTLEEADRMDEADRLRREAREA